MRSSVLTGFCPVALLFLRPVIAGHGWDGDDWGNQNAPTSTSCTDSLVTATSTQTETDSTLTLTATETVTYTLYPKNPTASDNWEPPSYQTYGDGPDQSRPWNFETSSIPSYLNSGWITKTWHHHKTVTVMISAPSESEWSYQAKPTWDSSAEPIWGSPYETVDSCATASYTTITITSTITETIPTDSAEASTAPISYGGQPASPSGNEPSPYAIPTLSTSCTSPLAYTSPSATPSGPYWTDDLPGYEIQPSEASSSAAGPSDPSAYNNAEQSSAVPEPTYGGPSPQGYQQSAYLPASVSESTAAPVTDSYQPPTTNPASYDDGSNNSGYIGYAWTA